MTIGLWLTAFGLGLRHGIDWDHIAAIADLSSTAENRRRGFVLSFLYAVGHGLIVIVLGTAAILFGATLPEGVDVWMGRVVGLTLVALGAWVIVELLRKGRDFRLRSRWILVISGTFTGLRRVREAKARRRLSIEHEHEHEHEPVDQPQSGSGRHEQPYAHDHDHLGHEQPADAAVEPDRTAGQLIETASGGTDVGRSAGLTRRWTGYRPGSRDSHGGLHGHSSRHSHSHRHETTLADTTDGTGNGTAAGIGLLHGVGFESPTQIAVFVASTSLVGAWAGFGLLLAWVLGLIIANSLLAGLAAYGLLGAERNFVIYATIAAFVGVASLAMGTMMLIGVDSVLPAL
ncbi:MAG: hypothetical protein ACR2QK_03555 [Acidimicrobiales bacterium]